MSYRDNYERIKEALELAFSETDLTTRLENIKIVENQINNYLERYKIISAGIKERYDQLTTVEMIGESESTRRYQAIKSYNKQIDLIKELLQQGYLYVDLIRQVLTGQSIKYQIGIVENGFLYTQTVSILDLVEASTLDVDSRINIKDAAKLRLIKTEAKALFNQPEEQLRYNVENSSSTFSAVYNFLTNSLHETPKKINDGNAYQVYKRVLYNRGGKNEIPPTLDFKQVERIYDEVKKNNAAYYKGGDFLNIQVKYLGGSPPTLTTLSSIKRVLEKTQKAFSIMYTNAKPKTALINGLVNLFTKNSKKITNEVQKTANEKAKKEIAKKLQSISGILYTQN